jgi:glycosyltransferase involved in cell wall biosynthesis
MPMPGRVPAAMTRSGDGPPSARWPRRVVLAHDWLVGMRGGERVLDAIARLCEGRFQIAGLFTMFADGAPHTPAIDRPRRFVSAVGTLPLANPLRRWMLPLYPVAVEDLSQRLAGMHRQAPIDLVISTSSAAIKGLRAPKGVPHLCYCHSPARYLWSQSDEYSTGGPRASVRGAGLRLFGERLRRWDKASAANVTHFVANSTHILREIARVYARPADVVHPPVRTEFFRPPRHGQERSGWLYVGALEPYKRVDLAIRAAGLANTGLTIVGRGSELKRLRKIAGPNVVFETDADDERLRLVYQRARMLIFPQTEDFGIVAAEAQACGTPVVAFGAGGALDTVVDGRTGVYFGERTPESLADAARRCAELGDVSIACRASAERFSEARFDREMLAIIERMVGVVSPPLSA